MQLPAKPAAAPIRETMSAFRFAVVVVVVGIGLTATSCSSGDSPPNHLQAETNDAPASEVEPTDAPVDLLEFARALIPEADAVTEEELAVEECGIVPALPCVRAYFVIEERARSGAQSAPRAGHPPLRQPAGRSF
jgi:hypothetical protein